MLIVVLLVTIMASMVAASLLFRMRAEVAQSGATTNGDQAYAASMSGIETAIALLTEEPTDGSLNAQSDPTLWIDNQDLFRNHLVINDGANRWYFTVYARSDQDPDNPRFGLTDEAGKVNINVAPEDVLIKLPGMTQPLVDTLMDYRDPDSDTRTDGAEQDYYDQLPTPYLIRNGQLSSLEELLLVKDFNARIVFGEDANLNGLLEPNEDDGDENFPPDNNDGVLDAGLAGAATVMSFGPDVDSAGGRRSNLNGGSQALSTAGLSSETTRFVDLCRADGMNFTHPSQLLDMTYRLRQENRQARLPAGTVIRSGVDASNIQTVMDKCTTNPSAGRVPVYGLVNVNTAPVAALATLPGIDGALAQSIVDARTNLDPESRTTTAWLYTQGLVSAEQYKTMAPMLTARGYQYRVRSIGFGIPCGRYRIMEAVIDVSQKEPRVIYLRDLTRLGPPFPLDAETEEAAAP